MNIEGLTGPFFLLSCHGSEESCRGSNVVILTLIGLRRTRFSIQSSICVRKLRTIQLFVVQYCIRICIRNTFCINVALYKTKRAVSFDHTISRTRACKVATPGRELSDLRENARKIMRERKSVVINKLMGKGKLDHIFFVGIISLRTAL